MAKEKETQPTGLIVPEVFKVGEAEINKTTLIAQRDNDVKLIINGIDDKESYKQAVALRAAYRTTRTTLEKYRKEVSAPHQAFVKKLKETTDELGAIAFTGEQYFDNLITGIDDEKERIKQQALMAEAKRIQARVNEIVVLGAVFDGEVYTFPYDVDLAIDSVGIKEATDDEFTNFLEDVKTAFATEQERLENEKLEAIRQEEEQAEQALAVAEQAKKNARDLALIKAGNEALRKKQLKLLGAVLQEEDDTYLIPDKPELHLPPLYALLEMTDSAWDELVYDIEHFVPATDPLVKDEPDHDEHPYLNDPITDDDYIPDGGDFEMERSISDDFAEPVDDYMPYGEEWEAEMKKWTKPALIAFLRVKLIELQSLKSKTYNPA